MNTSHFLRLLCASSSQCASGRKQKDEKPHTAPRAGQGANPLHSLLLSLFQNHLDCSSRGRPEIKYSSIFLSVIRAVWYWKGEGTEGSKRGKMPTSAKGIGIEI